jgi:perosamine synthetase
LKKLIPITAPNIDKEDYLSVYHACKNEWRDKCFDSIKRLEKNFSSKFGYKYSQATSSCTGALHLALLSLDIKKNDEVIVPDFTWISCSNVIEYVGAKPVFVDIDKKNWCIDVNEIEKKITKKTKAIICVHLYGNVCDMDKLLKIKKKYKIHLIEDCAEAIGAKYKNLPVGSFGDIATFSFHGTKLITGGEGGMFVTNDKKIHDKFLLYSGMGTDPKESKYFYHKVIGYKYKISNIQAALINSQLKKINRHIKIKKEIFNTYKKLLSEKYFSMNKSLENSSPVYWMPTLNINIPNFKKEDLIKFCKSKNIHLRPFFYPISSFPMYKKKINKVGTKISKQSVNLPSGYDLKKNDIFYVVKTIKTFINNNL